MRSRLTWRCATYATRRPGEWPETRRGTIVSIEGSEHQGIGEAAPLPGYNGDTLGAVDDALARAEADSGWATAIGEQDLDMVEALSIELATRSPAAACAVQNAALDFISRARGEALAELLAARAGAARTRSVNLNALLRPANGSKAMASAQAAWDAGVRALKLKVGRGKPSDEVELATRLRRRFGATLELRLDANGIWAPGEVPAKLRAFAGVEPRFCEQPSARGTLAGLPDELPVGIAADESVQDAREVARLLARPHPALEALVLKPMALGGPLPCVRLALQALKANLPIVVTHLLDGPVGVAAAAELAAALPDPGALRCPRRADRSAAVPLGRRVAELPASLPPSFKRRRRCCFPGTCMFSRFQRRWIRL